MENKKVTFARYSEIALKGKNRHLFEKKLVDNIRYYLKSKNIAYDEIRRKRGRVLIYSDEDLSSIKYVFGIHSISPAIETKTNIESMKEAVDQICIFEGISKFRVTTKRSDKQVPFKSRDIDIAIGDYVNTKYNLGVSMKEFDLNIGIEILEGKAYVFSERILGFLGLPVGTEGKAVVLSDETNYELCAWYLLKRGCDVVFYGEKKPIFKFLNKFSPRKNFFFKLSGDIKLKDFIEQERAHSIAVGSDAERFISLKNELNDQFLLGPLVGLPMQDIEEKIKFLESI